MIAHHEDFMRLRDHHHSGPNRTVKGPAPARWQPWAKDASFGRFLPERLKSNGPRMIRVIGSSRATEPTDRMPVRRARPDQIGGVDPARTLRAIGCRLSDDRWCTVRRRPDARPSGWPPWRQARSRGHGSPRPQHPRRRTIPGRSKSLGRSPFPTDTPNSSPRADQRRIVPSWWSPQLRELQAHTRSESWPRPRHGPMRQRSLTTGRQSHPHRP